MRELVWVKVEKIDKDIELPEYKNEDDSGMDIRSNKTITIKPQETLVIPTGLKVSIPSGYEIQVRARSGLSLKTPLRIANGIGTIDAGFKDELGIIVHHSGMPSLSSPITINKGDRIAQLVIQRTPMIKWEIVENVNNDSGKNRGGGFGSTGMN